MGKILAFFVGTAHVPIAHCHGLDAVFLEERLHLALHFRVRRDIRGNPALNDRLGPVTQDHAGSNLGRSFVIGTVKCDRADGIFGRFSVFGLELFDGVLPLVKFGVRKKVPIFFRDQPAGFLEGVDNRRVDPSRFHVLDHPVFQVFGMRHVVENQLTRAGFPPMLLDELPAPFLEYVGNLLGHWHGFEDVALVVLREVEVFSVAALLVLLAAAAGTGGVAGDFFAGHGFALISELLPDGFVPYFWRAA